MALKGIDISHHNIPVNWPAFIGQGCDFAIIKVSQGLWTQHTWNGSEPTDGHPRVDLLSQAQKNNMLVGGYHFLMSRDTYIQKGKNRLGPAGRPNQATGAEQARWFIAAVKRSNNNTMDNVLACLDWEALNIPLGDGREIRSRPDKNDVVSFEREFHRLQPGRPLVIYTTASYFAKLDLSKLLDKKRTLLWVAWWTHDRGSSASGNPPVAFFGRKFNGKTPILHQYGVLKWRGNGLTDTNSFVGNRTEWIRLTRKVAAGDPDPDPDPGPDPDPDPGPVDPDPTPGDDDPLPPVVDGTSPWHEPWLNPTTTPQRIVVPSVDASPSMVGVALAAALVAGTGFVVWKYGKGRMFDSEDE